MKIDSAKRFLILLIVYQQICYINCDEVAGNVQSALNNVGKTFQSAWKVSQAFIDAHSKLEDFVASTKKQDASKKLNDTYAYIADLSKQKDKLMELAKNTSDTQGQEAVNKLDQWKSDLETLQKKTDSENFLADWSNWAKNTYNGGLAKVIEMNKQLNSASFKSTVAHLGLIVATSLISSVFILK